MLVIGVFVRGLSIRDVESLGKQAGLGKLSEVHGLQDVRRLKERYEWFKRREFYGVNVVALFLDAAFIAVRPDGPTEGVLVASGIHRRGERVLLAVTLRMRESCEAWQALGRDVIAPELGAPVLIVADGAPRPCRSDRAVLAGLGWPALLCSARLEPVRQAPRARA